jgi:hypothetical protein
MSVAYLRHRLSLSRENARGVEQDKLDNWEKFEELLRLARESEEGLRKKRAEAREKIRQIQILQHEKEMNIREMIELERRQNLAFVRSLKSALEKLRYAFIKAARKRAPHLLPFPANKATDNGAPGLSQQPPMLPSLLHPEDD